jgi:hypothetical protein
MKSFWYVRRMLLTCIPIELASILPPFASIHTILWKSWSICFACPWIDIVR